MYNLSTFRDTRTPINNTSNLLNPLIYGSTAIWTDFTPVNVNSNEYYLLPAVYMYDLCTSEETRISGNAAAMSPEIYGNRIVWESMRNGNRDIYMYTVSEDNTDLNTEQQSQRAENKSKEDKNNPEFKTDCGIFSLLGVL